MMDLTIDPDEAKALGVGAAVGAVIGLIAAGRKHAFAGLGFGAIGGAIAGGLAEKQINAFLDAQAWLKSDTGQSLVGAVNAAAAELGPG